MQRAIDLRGAVAINVITMIGIGPLVTIPLVLAALGGPLALLAWIAGALLAACDGLVWAELSSRFPGSGGTYVYLREAFGAHALGRLFAFVFNWQYLLYAPCILASGYIAMTGYAAYLFPVLATNPWLRDGVAVGLGLLTIALLYRRTSQVSAISTAFGVAAVLTVALVAVAGLTHANFAQAFHIDGPVLMNVAFLHGFGTALYITMYDYAGYSEVALLGDEVVAPNRTIPRAILLSVGVVAVLYVALQVGVLGAVPWRSLLDAHGAPTLEAQYIGSTVVQHVWGSWPAIAVTWLVLITAFASLYGNLLGASRIPYAAARDAAFIPAFAKLHPTKDFPHVALLAVGGLSLIASFFTLDQVITILTAGIVLVGLLQMAALFRLRRTLGPAPFSMPFYPLPLLIDVAASIFAFCSTGWFAMTIGAAWLVAGGVIFLLVARIERWWPFVATAALALAVLALPMRASAQTMPPQWEHWKTSAVVAHNGYPVFTVDGAPFFVYGAAFFYERVPAMRWRATLQAYRAMGINTIDLYAIWNWHQPKSNVLPDFTGATDPQRNLLAVLALCHELGFKVILRPGPVIRNEWRNGGYPDWLLERPEYNMPLHDVLEGRYPATATFQNAHADAAAAEWLANDTHLRYSALWLHDVLAAVAPYASDVIAIALDDDQGAYMDNDTWPAPHWRAYVDWLRLNVQVTAGSRVPVFINTFENKVPAAAPAWAWGNWYQSGAYSIGAHDLAELDFATGLLATQPHLPVMQAEFQAGWLQGAAEGAPRPADPTNTTLALYELLRDGAHGIVNFPVQDTIYPDGWEVPWANWSYAWDAALTTDLASAPRYAPTAGFGKLVSEYGPQLADSHPVVDAGIVWPPSLFSANVLNNHDFAVFSDATIDMQRQCRGRGLTCTLVDVAYGDPAIYEHYPKLLLPIVIPSRLKASIERPVRDRLKALRASGRLIDDIAGVQPSLRGAQDATLLSPNDGSSRGFIVAVNDSEHDRSTSGFVVRARSAQLSPLSPSGSFAATAASPAAGTPPPFASATAMRVSGSRLTVAFAPNAGARISELSAAGIDNAASSVGLLRDAVDPVPSPSSRDYIAAYTHPLPAGTFNRTYDCTKTGTSPMFVTCAYDAPDIPAGGAHFQRTLELAPDGNTLAIVETFAPHDATARVRLQSVSGFAFAPGDTVIAPQGGTAIGILHGRRLATITWRSDEVASVEARATRGAELVTLTFSKPAVHLTLAIQAAPDAAEAERLLRANPAIR